MVFKHKVKKTSPEITIPENLDNEDLRETYMDLIYMGSRIRQDLLSKLGACDHGRGLKGRGEVERVAEKNVELN